MYKEAVAAAVSIVLAMPRCSGSVRRRARERSGRLRLLLAAAILGTASSSLANGRYPLANQVAIAPSDASYFALRSTFGIVQSFDAGKTWSWVCERSAGYSDSDEPSIGMTADGSILVGSEGLSVSHDRGCSWLAEEPLAPTVGVMDLDVDRERPSRAVVLTGSGDDLGGFVDSLFESVDNGLHFAPLGLPINDGLAGKTVELAPSGRIYLSGALLATNQGVLQFSDDGAMTWTRFLIELEGATLPFIAAVDPKNRDRVFVRSIASGGDRLFVTDDAGSSFRQVFSAVGGMYGFALSPDGTKVAVGGPQVGVNLASTTDYQFRQVSTVGPYCLRWTGAGLYACAKEAVDEFSMGLSKDEGAHFEPLLRLADIVPLVCPPETLTASTCGSYWGQVARLLGADAGDAAQGGGMPDGPALNPVSYDESPRGCQCRHSPAPRGGASYFFSALALVFALRRRPKLSRQC